MTTRTTDRISFRWPVLITALALGLFARAGWTSGETITQSIGTMEPGQSVTIVFDATIDNPQTPINNSQVCNQGLVSSANHADVQTDDPALGGAADSTCTAVDAPAGGTIVIVKDTVPDAAQDFQAVDAWQLQIQQDHGGHHRGVAANVRSSTEKVVQRFDAVACHDNGVGDLVLAEGAKRQGFIVRIVLDQQDRALVRH